MAEEKDKIREVKKERFVNIFLRGLDKENEESIQEHFAIIEEKIIKHIGNKDFIPRYKDAIIYFGEWFLEEFERDELEDFISDDYVYFMPLIMIIYFDLINDKIYTNEYEPWDKYIKIFNAGYKNSIESLVAQIAYINTYFSLREDKDEEFYDKNIEALTIFFTWFNEKYSNEKVDAAISDCWLGEYPYIYLLCEDYLDLVDSADVPSDEEIEEMIKDVENDYKKLDYSQRKNIDILTTFVFDIAEDRTLFICPLDYEPMEPISIPAVIHTNNVEFKKDLQQITRAIKGYLSNLLKDGGVFIVSHVVNEKTVVFNGFFLAEKEVYCLDSDVLAETVEFIPEGDLSVVYEVADLVFAN